MFVTRPIVYQRNLQKQNLSLYGKNIATELSNRRAIQC